MAIAGRSFWKLLPVQHKLWTILLVVFVPLICALISHLYLLNLVQTLKEQHHQAVLARDQVNTLRRLAVDIEDAFRGYLLTRRDQFLTPLIEAEPKVAPTVDQLMGMIAGFPELSGRVENASRRLTALIDSKHYLIGKIRMGRDQEVLDYVQSLQGIALSDALRGDFRGIEDAINREIRHFDADEARLVRWTYWGLTLAVGATLALGLLHARLLSRSITEPVVRLQGVVCKLSGTLGARREVVSLAGRTPDEIEQLSQGVEEMAHQLRMYLRELETVNAIGHDINAIGADGLHGVLRRITDGAVALLQCDVCLVMLRNEEMGCWVVEAASGEWADPLQKAVMLWEEFPVSVQAFETREPVIGDDLHQDERPEVRRRNLIGESMLSVPLLSQGLPFGVLVLLMKRKVPREAWNLRLASSFADAAALAIANARMYDAVHRKEKTMELRLNQLEHLAVTLAHDMKGPGERMGELAAHLVEDYGHLLDDRAARWLRLMEEEGKELTTRIESIFQVARIGARPEALEAVDPAVVLADVLKQRAGELERLRAQVRVPDTLALVACHHAYLRQVFDNLISNALKFSQASARPEICITARKGGAMMFLSVSDNGPGIPPQHRARVFEPFARLQPGGVRGSGIGLTIVKRIVEMYGGRVWIEEQGTPGCTVTFSLPLLVDRSGPLPDAGGADPISRMTL